jgi:hypothetical protein
VTFSSDHLTVYCLSPVEAVFGVIEGVINKFIIIFKQLFLEVEVEFGERVLCRSTTLNEDFLGSLESVLCVEIWLERYQMVSVFFKGDDFMNYFR